MLWSSVKITSYLFSLFFNFSCGVVVECENHFVKNATHNPQHTILFLLFTARCAANTMMMLSPHLPHPCRHLTSFQTYSSPDLSLCCNSVHMAADAEALSRRLAAVDIDGVEAADKISFEIQKSTRYFFLHPSATEPTKVKDQDAYKPYLLKVEQNVKAEYWAFLEDTSYGFPGWRSKKLKKYHIEPRFTPVESEDDERIMYDILDLRTGVSTDENFHWSLVIWKGSLCILYAPKNQYRREDDEPTLYSILPGMSMSEQWPDVADRGAEHVLFNYGYIGDRMNDMSAVKTLSSESTPPSLIRSVANPERRQMSSFKIDGHESQPLEDSVVPISTSQRSILDALQYDIEFIQGPPGTGNEF